MESSFTQSFIYSGILPEKFCPVSGNISTNINHFPVISMGTPDQDFIISSSSIEFNILQQRLKRIVVAIFWTLKGSGL
ncbi:hypothetical protein [Chryseobacterium sp. 52]|uniref:hypothetical protein n=1 Tax=Chryseobacterium sp. 52 TaxID=2035213 RepID=UPI001180ADA7|nr:hypothetical protein [Chryseobacterium sp. 52]